MFIEIQEIPKEKVPDCSFQMRSEINQDPNLARKLHDAMVLGNNHRGKVEIIFCDDEGMKKVNTTIWAKGDKFITLKGGVWIPISKIVDIIF